jgi:phage gp46-like protein
MLRLEYDGQNQWSDLLRPTEVNLYSDELLYTAVMISLFTRRLAGPGDVLPDPRGPRHGWWGDAFEKIPAHRLGSRLWLLQRSKTTQSVLNLARDYAKESLQWLIDDGVAGLIDVAVERQDSDRLAFRVAVTRPDDVASRWAGVWIAHLAEL